MKDLLAFAADNARKEFGTDGPPRTLPFCGETIDLLKLRDALGALSRAFVAGNQGSFGMHIPAEPYRDGDMVCSRSALAIDRLIERTDELADALRRLTNLHDNEVFVCGVDDESGVRDVLSAARAALAKAGVT